MTIDIRTLFIISIPLFGCFALTTFYLWLSNREIARGVGYWTSAFALQSIASGLFAFRDVLNDILSISIANGLCTLAFVLFFDGISLFAGKRSGRNLNYFVLAVVVALFVYFGFVDVNLSIRIITISLTLAFLHFRISYLAYSCREDDEGNVYSLISVLLIITGFFHLVRIPITLLVHPGSEFMASNIYQSFYIILFVLSGAFMAICLILLVNSRLNSIQQNAKTSLAESEGRFKQLSNATFEGIVMHDMGRLLDCNQMALDMFQYTREEVMGEDIHSFIAPEDRAKVQKVIAEENEDPYEAVFQRKDGTTFYAELHGKKAFVKGQRVRVVAIRDITERKNSEMALRQALKVKETLLKEIHHRVKNNMQTISSLLTLQSRDEDDEKINRIISESKARIHTMAMIHEMLYKSESLDEVEFGSYMEGLIEKIKTALVFDQNRIVVKVDAGQVILSHDQAIPCALSVTELLLNAIEHAFPGGRSGEITIKVGHLDKDKVLISVSDNGVGMQEAGESTLKAASLGLSLVDSLVGDQLKGSFQQEALSDGTRFTIKFTRVP